MGAFARARGLETHRVSVLLAFLGGFSPLDGEPGPFGVTRIAPLFYVAA